MNMKQLNQFHGEIRAPRRSATAVACRFHLERGLEHPPMETLVIPPETITTPFDSIMLGNSFRYSINNYHTKTWLIIDDIPVYQRNITTIRTMG